MPSPLVCAGATLSARAPDDDIASKTSLLVQRLADEATRARQEVDRLHTTRSQWVPPVCKKAVKLPTVCARPLADAQATGTGRKLLQSNFLCHTECLLVPIRTPSLTNSRFVHLCPLYRRCFRRTNVELWKKTAACKSERRR